MVMAPRFVNPHFLPDTAVLVSRKQIYNESDDDAEASATISSIDDDLVKELHRLIHASLDSDIRPDVHQVKRRKVEVEPTTQEQKGSVLFRLVSNSQTLYPLSLEPKPPPPPITREPDCEDNAMQAKTRRKQAKAAAVNVSSILKESREQTKQSSNNIQKCSVAKAVLPTPTPVIMLLQRDQPFRTTRPPVPAHHLTQRPYVKNGPLSSTAAATKISICPVIGMDSSMSTSSKNETKRRGKRRKKANRAHAPPSFWRPNPAHRGKSLGYGMGYPCSLAALGNTYPTSHTQSHYPRDKMRKGVHIDSLA